MPAFASRITRPLLLATLLAIATVTAQAQEATSRQLAPGFTARAHGEQLHVRGQDQQARVGAAGGEAGGELLAFLGLRRSGSHDEDQQQEAGEAPGSDGGHVVLLPLDGAAGFPESPQRKSATMELYAAVSYTHLTLPTKA